MNCGVSACCAVALPTLSKNRVIIRNRKAAYSSLYDLAIDVLGKECMQLRPEAIESCIMRRPCFSKTKSERVVQMRSLQDIKKTKWTGCMQ